jgi:hypothetical protein
MCVRLAAPLWREWRKQAAGPVQAAVAAVERSCCVRVEGLRTHTARAYGVRAPLRARRRVAIGT